MEEDDAIIDFYFDVIFTEPEPLTAHTFYPFASLMKYIQKAHTEFYSYIEEVQAGIDDWGPKERQTMEALGEEAIGLLYSYLEEYLLSCNWMEAFYKQQIENSKHSLTRQIIEAEKATDIFKKLETGAINMFNEQKRYRQFCRLVEKEAMRIAVEVYPELLDANQELMKNFKYVFTDGIIKMHDDLTDHLDQIDG